MTTEQIVRELENVEERYRNEKLLTTQTALIDAVKVNLQMGGKSNEKTRYKNYNG